MRNAKQCLWHLHQFSDGIFDFFDRGRPTTSFYGLQRWKNVLPVRRKLIAVPPHPNGLFHEDPQPAED